ncbi:MAG: polysaccharide ABC transporter ATP-binding protein [Paludibacter sp.]|nr:polysaccharide ABC transporter ATP-binding protein [Bacteroidales bacterium]MCM1069089.1 polysaccharide ABC transporter ATP-binding protein [Prevotella sp.]MCM1353528.1 polysaccharide ABC transporter ATP-binding protein [Bacteroides sp.]MCM1442689.1 polysaccharide ABC transporter ATP-binding protein [Muribaculum sp.]MCM1481675.1 polysaccharide ABC transporter ATP-binding protein [Paludibacter sp.]
MTAIEFNHISKQYRLGLVSTRTLSHDLNRWWQTSILHHEDPYLKIGETNDRSTKSNSEYVWALRDIDFKVEQGDVVGIIGKNGAGKSTLLKLLSRVTTPTTGTIRARGRIASLLEVGTGFHPEMTGRENIYMNGAIMGMTKQEITRKLDEIVAFSGCERYIDTPVKRYSSGMTVRLGFAIAAHLDPEILVVDEVLAVGDAEFQKKAIGKMQDISQGQGRTVLFVSHNMASIKALCKSGVLLENGNVSFLGTAEDTINRYLAINIESQSGDMSLVNRTDRRGTGKMRVIRVDFRNINNDLVDELFYAQYLKIEISFTKDNDVDLSNLIVSCGFEDAYCNRANEWVSDELEHDFTKIENGKITLVVPSITMRPNTYFFHFKLMLNSTGDHNIADAMHFAKQLHIMHHDDFQNGMRLREGRGYEAVVPAFFVRSNA